MYDVIIVGAGMAGLTAGIYAARGKMKVLILEKNVYGGQIITSPHVENYPGYSDISGVSLAKEFYEQAISLGCEIKYETVIKIDENTVKTDKNVYQTKTIILATGLTRRTLGLPKEETFIGRGLSYCATCDGRFFKDKTVAVVGGGNTALEDILYLSHLAKRVYVILRRDQFRGDKILVERVMKCPNVCLLKETRVNEIIGDSQIEGVKVLCGKEETFIKIQGLFIAIGLIPDNEFLSSFIELDEDGFIKSNDCSTNIPNIFVAGDARTKNLRQIITAASDGAIAAMKAIEYLHKNER